MANHVLLNNINHKNLKVITEYSEKFGDNIQSTLTFPTEFGDVQREYPILFRKDPATGKFQAMAIFGFEKDENLFLSDSGWAASYIPGLVARGPFLIGFQEQEINGELRKEPVIHIDMDSPRLSEEVGEPVFLPHGGNTPYLDRIATILKGVNEGLALSNVMFAAYESMGLIEPVNIDIRLSDSARCELRGYYTISEEKLAKLQGPDLEKLHKHGFLQGAFLVASSLRNMKKLSNLKAQKVMREGTFGAKR
jgi:hypothetical protein